MPGHLIHGQGVASVSSGIVDGRRQPLHDLAWKLVAGEQAVNLLDEFLILVEFQATGDHPSDVIVGELSDVIEGQSIDDAHTGLTEFGDEGLVTNLHTHLVALHVHAQLIGHLLCDLAQGSC